MFVLWSSLITHPSNIVDKCPTKKSNQIGPTYLHGINTWSLLLTWSLAMACDDEHPYQSHPSWCSVEVNLEYANSGSVKVIPVSYKPTEVTSWDVYCFRAFMLDEWDVHLYTIIPSLPIDPTTLLIQISACYYLELCKCNNILLESSLFTNKSSIYRLFRHYRT